MPIDPNEWYEQQPDYTYLSQGDILDDVPVVMMPPASTQWILLRPAPPVTVPEALAGKTPKSFRPQSQQQASTPWADGRELVLAQGRKRRVMLVNHGCDIENRNYYQVAPVYPGTELKGAKQDSLRANEITYIFYLPAKPPRIPEDQFADLSQLSAVHKSYLREAVLVERLTPTATGELQRHLGTFYNRPFGFAVTDIVTRSGDYLCANCFWTRALIQRVEMTVGVRFSPCPICREDALWVIAPRVRTDTRNWLQRLLGR